MNKTIIKVISIVMVLTLTMLTFVACGEKEDFTKVDSSSTTTETTTEAPKPTNVNPLTGVADLSESAIGARPVAIMVENSPEARPQFGMSSADVIVEGMVEGGITRMMWLFADAAKIPKVEPVRSARHDFVEIALGLNAIYTHWGGSGQATNTYAYGTMNKYDIDHIDGIAYEGKYFKRDSSRTAPHNGYTNGELITKAISALKINQKAKDSNWTMFKVVEDGVRLPFGGASGGALEANVTFSSSYKYSFKYNMEKSLYYSYLNGKAVKDGSNSTAVAFSNVIIMFANVGGVQTSNPNDKKLREWDLSSGEAIWLSQGVGEKITWKKGDATSPLKFYGSDGKELIINKGKTWVGVVPVDQKANLSIKES